jgi:hypothetical protein
MLAYGYGFFLKKIFARFATNKYRNTFSVGNMLQHLEWRSLQDRRKDSRLNMFYKAEGMLAFLVMLFMCDPHLRSELIVTPRYSAFVT